MNLFRAEMRRLMRRRLSWIFGLAAVAGLLLFTGVIWFTSQTEPTADQLAYAEEMVADQQQELQKCLDNEDYFVEEWGWAEDDPDFERSTHEELCHEWTWGTEIEDHLWGIYIFDFKGEGPLMLSGVLIVVGLLMMLLAASSVGAEWPSGGIANLLVWHPNRMKVWAAKVAASLTLGLAALLVLAVLGFGLLYLTAAVRGQVGDLTGTWWNDTIAMLTRTAALGLGMTLLGISLAMLGRHTAIAGGVIAGYLIVGDLLVRLAGFALNVKYPDMLSLYTWVAAWISDGVELWRWDEVLEKEVSITITAAGSAALLGGVIALFTVLATWSFAKRDVT
jgi:ABC-type transport system involved in multi-copper enzyme maturation permease subunit